MAGGTPVAAQVPPSGGPPPPPPPPPTGGGGEGGAGSAGQLNLTIAPTRDAEISVSEREEIPPNTRLWAEIARPFSFLVMGLVGATVLLPLVGLYRLPGATVAERTAALLDWSKTILSPVIGFGSAVIGYYFGTRGRLSQARPPEGGSCRVLDRRPAGLESVDGRRSRRSS